jgi:alpha-N-arabinofuranosidase
LPSYLEWDRTVLEQCWESIDFISAHRYSRNDRDDTKSFLAEGVVIDEVLDDYRGVLAYVKARKRSRHRVHVSFDEWNVWYRERGSDGGWTEAPPLLEEIYNVEDALVCAQYLHSFVRNADIVRLACLAQIVNVIAPVLTRRDGLLVQTIFWPFKLLRDAVSGEALRAAVRAPEIATRRGDVPVIDVAATYDDVNATACVSLVNRDPTAAVEVTIDVAGASFDAASAQVITGDPKAHNDWGAPNVIRPIETNVQIDERAALRVRLPAPSHAVISLRRVGGTP